MSPHSHAGSDTELCPTCPVPGDIQMSSHHTASLPHNPSLGLPNSGKAGSGQGASLWLSRVETVRGDTSDPWPGEGCPPLGAMTMSAPCSPGSPSWVTATQLPADGAAPLALTLWQGWPPALLGRLVGGERGSAHGAVSAQSYEAGCFNLLRKMKLGHVYVQKLEKGFKRPILRRKS